MKSEPEPERDDSATTVNADAIEALQQELAASNVLLVGLGRELASQRVETTVRVEGLRAEQHRERRVRMMAVVGGAVSVVCAYDQHVEHCSPGSRVTRAVDWLITHPPKPGSDPLLRQSEFSKHYDSAPWWCDVSMPLHTHDGGGWPSVGNAAGGALVGIAVLMTVIYHRFRTIRDFAQVAEAVKVDERHSGA